ncbi:WD40 repeat-like protein [Auriscalpium vulgare]|uniref:WD40 repeat-like protein n=1 Tax=Auriscalpium vulgare TaxID=40419 RepID=A0ACB8SAJ3_9AGAM|nr:WD40 repeat-like protein [Auriscalpium vulgare]
MASAPLTVNADEVNCLIYAYLQDSGFRHTAFSLRHEGRLEHSSNFTKHIPRGELVELLIKALLYMEVEAHWQGSDLTANCSTGFSLLQTHVCSLSPASVKHTIPAISSSAAADILDSVKRKASTPATDDGRSEKRVKTDTEAEASALEQTPDPSSKVKKDESHSDITTDAVMYDASMKTSRRAKSPGPEDTEIDPGTIQLLSAHNTEVFVCAWNPTQSNLLASGSKDAVVYLWNVPGPSKDGSPAPPVQDGPVTLIDARQEEGDLTSLDWNSDGTLLSVGSFDACLRVCTKGGERYYTSSSHKGPIFATRFSPSGRWLLSASLDHTACVWDIKARRLHRQVKVTDSLIDVDWMDDENYAICGADRMIHVLHIDHDIPRTSFCGHGNEINQVKFNETRSHFASCSDDHTARIWRASDIAPVSPKTTFVNTAVVLAGHRNSVNGVSWCPQAASPNQMIVATSSFDQTARLWDAETGACLKVFANHKRPIYTLTFSPDGIWFATGSGDGWLHVYSVKEQEKVWSWRSEPQKRSIFEIDWQQTGDIDRIAMALESRKVGVIDVKRLPALQRKTDSA